MKVKSNEGGIGKPLLSKSFLHHLAPALCAAVMDDRDAHMQRALRTSGCIIFRQATDAW